MEQIKNRVCIVLGSRGVNATGLIRSLGEAGIAVTFASTFSNIESRYNTHYLKLSSNQEKMKKELIEYCKQFSDKPVIFPTDDSMALFLDSNYSKLKQYCVFSNAQGNLTKIADKSVMTKLAQECGVAVPYTEEIDLKSNQKTVEFPVIIKPNVSANGSKGDICICYTEDEYKNAIDKFRTKGYDKVLVQQFLETPEQYEVGVMGMSLADGTVIIPGVIHKIRSYPIKRGSTSFAKIENDFSYIDVLSLKKFISATGYVGVFDIEMIISRKTAWFIEVNFRNGQYGYSITKAGYNLPVNWYFAMTGGNITQPSVLEEIYYMNEREDYLHVKDGVLTKQEWKKQFKEAKAYGVYCRSDIRPFIRQYVKVPDRVIIKFNKLKNRLKDLLIKEEWTLAIRKIQDKLLFEDGGTKKSFTILNNSLRYWAADPFIITKDEKDYIFFEMFDRLKGKGLIGYREINNGKFSKMKVAYERETHISFPFIFEYKGEIYMMPESSKDHTLPVLKAVSFPDKWQEVKNLNNGERFVDSVLFEQKDEVYLFTQQIQNVYSFDKLYVFQKKGDKFIPHKNNPVVVSSENARLAGKVFAHKDSIIRVSQDCSEDYGRKLTFNLVKELSIENYCEEVIGEITVDDVALNKKRTFCGIHTYNKNNNYEIIDLKNTNRIRLFNIFNLWYKLIFRI